MNWNETMDGNRQMLQRIVALLLALADLADRASRRSPAVRRLVLWILHPAEAAAWACVARLTQQPAPTPFRLADDSAAEAIRLALSFRMLASVLAVLPDEVLAEWLVDVSWQPALDGLVLCLSASVFQGLLTAHELQRFDSS